VLKAARTEQDLEDERLSGAPRGRAPRGQGAGGSELAPESGGGGRPEPEHAPAHPLAGADGARADPTHLPVVAAMVHEREQQLRAQHSGPNEVTAGGGVVGALQRDARGVVRAAARGPAARGVTREVISRRRRWREGWCWTGGRSGNRGLT